MTKGTGNCIPQVLSPSFMASPKYIKVAPPQAHSGVAKELAYIIKPLVGQSPHHLKNIQHFIQQIHNKRLETGEVITSFDVKALFTSVPVNPSISIVQQTLAQDPTLPQRTSMSIQHIVTLLEICLKNTYFLFQGKFYE